MNKVLIFRVGHIGDTYKIVPILKYIRNKYINSEITILFNENYNSKTVDIKKLLEDTNLVNNFISYKLDLLDIFKLFIKISKNRYSELIYLSPTLKLSTVLRDYIFFKLTFINKLKYFPFKKTHRKYLRIEKDIYENETNRYLRIINENIIINKHTVKLDYLNTKLNKEEDLSINLLKEIYKNKYIINIHPGTKIQINNWGLKNWKRLVSELIKKDNIHLIITGSNSKSELEFNDEIFKINKNKITNLTGVFDIKNINLIYTYINLYVGHDTGLMHIAASRNVPIFGIFSNRFQKGIWYPFDLSNKNYIFYPTCCEYLYKNKYCQHYKKCILSINYSDIVKKINELN